MAIIGCSGPPQIFNGDTISFFFDHSLVSFTVNGMPGDPEGPTWEATGLAPGEQTLLIEWVNRIGSDPATGCHEVQIKVM